MECAVCRRINPPDSSYCNGCGTPLAGAEPASSGRRPRREALHLRIAAALEDLYSNDLTPYFPLLATHYESGGQLPRAAQLLEQAGDDASAHGDVAAAINFYRESYRVLAQLPGGDRRQAEQIDVACKLARVSEFQLTPDHIPRLEAVLRLARESADRERVGKSLFWLSRTHHAHGHIAKALEYAAEGRLVVDPVTDPRSAALMEVVFGHACLYAGRFAESADCLKRGLPALMDDFGELAHAHGALAMDAAFLGQFQDAYAHVRQARELAQPGKSILRSAGVTLQKQWVDLLAGNWAAVREDDGTFARAGGLDGATWMLGTGIREVGMGYATFMAGWLEGGLASMRLGLAKLNQTDSRLTLSLSSALFAEAAALTGLVEEAEDLGHRALEDIERGERYAETIALRALALSAAAAGRMEEAVSRFDQSARLSAQRGGRTNLAITKYRWAEMWLQNGNRAAALALLGEASQAFAEMGMRWWFEQAARLAH